MDALEKIFGTTAQMLVLKNLIEHQNDLTYISRIAKETGFSNSIVSKVIRPLVDSGIVIEKPLGTLRIIHLNLENESTNLIIDFYHKLKQLIT
jgi:DNA-binding MarR family transcriptional regulator